jgi:hypothetical protein
MATKIYTIISSSDLSNINYNEVLETSASTTRCSLDDTWAIIKYFDVTPLSITSLPYTPIEYTHNEIQNIITGSNWLIVDEIDLDI